MSAGVILVILCAFVAVLFVLAREKDQRHRAERAISHVWSSLSTLQKEQVVQILKGEK